MCLMCEELWMPFDLPPQANVRRFVADAPEPEGTAAPDEPSPAAPPPDPPDGSR